MPIFLGLDCGGSTTRACALDDTGEKLFEGQSGAANIASTPEVQLITHLHKACTGGPKPQFVCACFAGLLTTEDAARASTILSAQFPFAKLRIEPDYAAAIASCPRDTDVCVIAGTGSLVCSRANGVLTKSGGKGYILGDRGSGFQYGRAVFSAYLEGSCTDAARRSILDVFETTDESEMLSKLYRVGSPPARLAKLSPAFADDVREGVPYATEFLESETAALASVVSEHIKKNFKDKNHVNICLTGGLWKASGVYRDAFEKAMQRNLPNIEMILIKPELPPVQGAVILAKELVTA